MVEGHVFDSSDAELRENAIRRDAPFGEAGDGLTPALGQRLDIAPDRLRYGVPRRAP